MILCSFFQSTRNRGTQTARDAIASETERLAFDIVFYSLGKRKDSSSDDDLVKCMRLNVKRLLDKHSIGKPNPRIKLNLMVLIGFVCPISALNGMISRLRINRDTDFYKGFMELSTEVFYDNHVTWSRILTMFAFGARLAQHCSGRGYSSSIIVDIASGLSQMALERISPFLKQQGGWV